MAPYLHDAIRVDPIVTSAASGMRARIESLDLLANNIANTSTPGFKADREFYGLYISAEAKMSNSEGLPRPLPVDSPEIEHHWTDLSQGPITETGKPFDLALSGQGYFEILTPGGTRFTRNGNFRIGKKGNIETQQGDTLSIKPPDGREFALDPSLPANIQATGEIYQGTDLKGTIQLRNPLTSGAVAKQGNSYFKVDKPDDPAGAAPEQTGAEIHQGFLETSNVAAADSAVRLVSVMRQFEMLQKATTMAIEMNKKAIDEVGRVSG